MSKRNIETTFHTITVIDLRAGCNNSCAFCGVKAREEIPPTEELLNAISEEARSEYKEIVFCGGEPTLYPRLSALIRRAKNTGFNRIRIETNARMFAYDAYAKKIAEAGLTEVAVLLPAATEDVYGAMCGPAEGIYQAIIGIQNLKKHNPDIVMTASVPVSGSNYHELPRILAVATSVGISKVSIYEAPGFRAAEFDGLDALKKSLVMAADLAGLRKMECMLEGDLAKLMKAEMLCSLMQRPDEIDDRAAIMFCPTSFTGFAANPEMLEALIRTNFSCNQICNYCWVDRETPNPPEEEVLSMIARAGRDGLFRLSFSGGEPTLNPKLPEFVAAAKASGIRETVLHTNAVKLANPDLCRALDDAGLDIAYVTMLAGNAAVSDNITRTDGSFRKTVRGVQNLLLKTDIFTFLHFVITKDNYKTLPEFVDFADRTFTAEDGSKLPITFSYVAPPRPDVITHVPRYSEAVSYLKQAMDMCVERGIPFGGNEGLKSLPPCVLDGDKRYFRSLMPLTRETETTDYVKKPECAECDFNRFCYGVRMIYSLNYGLDEINPIRPK